jgi:hypothetical protein
MLRIIWQGPQASQNAAFSLATPIDSTHHVLSAHAHNLPQYVGKGRRLQALQLSRYHLYNNIMQMDMDTDATRARGMCSIEL